MRGRSISAVALVAGLASGVAAAPAAASSSASSRLAPATPVSGRVNVDVGIKRFVVRGQQVRATGVVEARLQGVNAAPTTVRQRVELQVRPGSNCQILVLTLDQLNLVLLGVTVHLDRVELSVTGERQGGVLGRLFCSLAQARVRSARAAAAATLNHGLRGRPMHVMRFGVEAHVAQATPAATCSILDLVLGPLHLDLLGLVVDLNRVHLAITGDPAGGVLGRLLCGVSSTTVPIPAPGA
jgi:hypothetical protein